MVYSILGLFPTYIRKNLNVTAKRPSHWNGCRRKCVHRRENGSPVLWGQGAAMKEYEAEVLEQYDMEVRGTRKMRGAFFCDTDEGAMLLK